MDIKNMEEKHLQEYIKTALQNDEKRKIEMIRSLEYYQKIQEILNKKRYTIGEGGFLVEVKNLPNAKIVDNQFAKAVDQKNNYLLSNAPVIKCKQDENYQELIQSYFQGQFMRTLNKIGLESIIAGISWLYVYPNEKGDQLKYKKVDTTKITPCWSDKEEESLDALIYEYSQQELIKGEFIPQDYLILYGEDFYIKFKRTKEGIERLEEGSYIENGEEYYSFGKIPFIYFKGNSTSTPLLNKCKSLQDAINLLLSNFQDNMVEDGNATIFILNNYDGEDLGEFRSNIANLRAAKVESFGEAPGKIDTIEVKVNADNYERILTILKEKLIENTRSIDTKNSKMTQAQNQLDIKNMYADIELDANGMELEFQASINHLEWFIKKIEGKNYPEDLYTNILFKRNITINDESIIEMIKNSYGIISKETLVANHPMVTDYAEEMEKISEEQEKEIESYSIYPQDINRLDQ